MKAWPRSLNIPGCLLAAAIPVFGQADLQSDLDPIRLNRNIPGISAVVVKQGRILAQGAAGFRRQGQPEALLVTDPVNIASCTKWMTATVAGRLVDRGVITWTTRVRDLFTNFQTFHASFHNATLDQFLAHRTGVQQESTFNTNHWAELMAQNGTLAELRRWTTETVLRDAPEVTPGTYLYANASYTVAGAMLELASGKDWETLVREEIFFPTRMASATLGQVYDASLPPRTAVGHSLATGQTVPVPIVPMNAATHLRYQSYIAPGGFTACTLYDWIKFLHAHATSDLSDYLSAATATRLQQPWAGTEGFGRGINVFSRAWASPGKALFHAGDIFGHDTVVWMAPARDFIVVVFVNCRSADNRVSGALDDAAGLLVTRYAGATASGPWLETPEIFTPVITNDNISFQYSTLPGISYFVESSADIAVWVPANGAGGQVAAAFRSSYANATAGPRKFFRVRLAP